MHMLMRLWWLVVGARAFRGRPSGLTLNRRALVFLGGARRLELSPCNTHGNTCSTRCLEHVEARNTPVQCRLHLASLQ